MSETPQEVCRSLLWLLSLSCLMLHSTSYSSDVACCMVFRKVESQNLQLSLWVNPTNLDWLPHQWGNRCPQFLYHLISFSKPNCKGCFHESFKSWCLPQADHCTSGLCHDGVDCAWGNWNEWSDCVPAKLSVLRHVRLFMHFKATRIQGTDGVRHWVQTSCSWVWATRKTKTNILLYSQCSFPSHQTDSIHNRTRRCSLHRALEVEIVR